MEQFKVGQSLRRTGQGNLDASTFADVEGRLYTVFEVLPLTYKVKSYKGITKFSKDYAHKIFSPQISPLTNIY